MKLSGPTKNFASIAYNTVGHIKLNSLKKNGPWNQCGGTSCHNMKDEDIQFIFNLWKDVADMNFQIDHMMCM